MTEAPATPPPAPAAAPAAALDVDRAVVAAGVALLATAVVLSTLYTRSQGHLDGSNYTIGLLATAGLLGVAVASYLGVVVPRGVDATTDLVAWPGAFGVVGVGLMIAVGMDDSDATPYVAGLAVVVLSALGYLLTWRAPFVVTAIPGFFVVYTQLFDDLLGFSDNDDIGGIATALALTVFALLVTGAGWALPTRALSGVIAGVITVAGFASLTGVLAVASVFQSAFSVPSDDSFDDFQGGTVLHDYDTDAWVILLLALALVVIWTACAAITRHVGFRLLVVAMAVSVTPLATVVLRVVHPTWWGVAVAAAGGLLLVLVGVRAVRRPNTSSAG
jgi:hypothetical protein